MDKVTRRSAGDASRLNRPPTGRTAPPRSAHRCVLVEIHQVFLSHAPCQPGASRPLGELANLGVPATLFTGCQDRRGGTEQRGSPDPGRTLCGCPDPDCHPRPPLLPLNRQPAAIVPAGFAPERTALVAGSFPSVVQGVKAVFPRPPSATRVHPPCPGMTTPSCPGMSGSGSPHPPATILPGRRGVAQSGRAPGSGSGGRRFKSCRPDAARLSGRVPAPRRPRHPVLVGGAVLRLVRDGYSPSRKAPTTPLKRVYSAAHAGPETPGGFPFFLPLLLDFPELDVMELARMFAPCISARSAVRVRTGALDAGSLPLDPTAHILSARLAGAGTQRLSLSYRR